MEWLATVVSRSGNTEEVGHETLAERPAATAAVPPNAAYLARCSELTLRANFRSKSSLHFKWSLPSYWGGAGEAIAFVLSTTYVTMSLAGVPPTLPPCGVLAGTLKLSPALNIIGGLPSMTNSISPCTT